MVPLSSWSLWSSICTMKASMAGNSLTGVLKRRTGAPLWSTMNLTKFHSSSPGKAALRKEKTLSVSGPLTRVLLKKG